MKLARAALVMLMFLLVDASVRAQTAPPDPVPPPGEVPAIPTPQPSARPPAVPSAPARLVLSQPLVRRARRLWEDLDALGRSGRGRVTAGVIQIGVGAAFATMGAFVPNEIGRSLLILAGAASIAHGTFQLTLVEDAETLSKQYSDFPVFTPQQLAERVRFGEEALRKIARGARRARIADGTLAMTVAVTYVPLLWWLERREDPSYRFGDYAFDYVALALAAINFGTGLVTALVSSDAERRLREYDELRASLSAEPASGSVGALSLQVGMLHAGACLSGRLRF